MTDNAVLAVNPLGFPWETPDPFLMCVFHEDAYPAGNDRLGPAASLEGRDIGQDFAGKDGWRMYHGDVVPGFPQHPHRGFETVTIVRKGFVDHSDSLGATARFGPGDVQWLTAGKGIVHCEMLPLVNNAAPNPVELFQIWLNLPSKNKLVAPHFSMFWRESIPMYRALDSNGRAVEVEVIAGDLGSKLAPPPPPESWASREDSDVAIWIIKMAAGASWQIPRAAPFTNRSLYVVRGGSLRVADRTVSTRSVVRLRPDADVPLINGPEDSELLILQGRPIGEPVAQHGPFVMNSRAELQQAFSDYHRTHFGGWPWPTNGPVHARESARFARHPDGRVERAP